MYVGYKDSQSLKLFKMMEFFTELWENFSGALNSLLLFFIL